MNARTSSQRRASRALRVGVFVLGCGAVVTTPAWAQQSVTIVGGSLTVFDEVGLAAPVWTLVGDGISVVAVGGDSGNSGGQGCPCQPGSQVNMGGTFGGTTLGSGQAVVNGTLFPRVFFDGVLSFHASAAVMPDFDGNNWRNVTVPFNLEAGGHLVGYADSNRLPPILLNIQLSGRGTATLHVLERLDPTFSFYDFRSITYTFGPGVNLLEKPGFEEYTPPALGVPGWVSDTIRQTPAFSDSTQPHSGANNGVCMTTDALDCGIYQEVTAPSTGTYQLTFSATADRDGGLIGANVNGAFAVSSPVEARGVGHYGAAYTMTFAAMAGDTIRVWMYSPAIPGFVVIDDVSLIGPQ